MAGHEVQASGARGKSSACVRCANPTMAFLRATATVAVGLLVGALPPAARAAHRPAAEPQNAPTSIGPVLSAGEGGYASFRIPGIVATDSAAGSRCGASVLVLVAEGRRYGCDDFDGQHDIVAKRSTDGGRHWGPLQIVADPVGIQLHPGLVDPPAVRVLGPNRACPDIECLQPLSLCVSL